MLMDLLYLLVFICIFMGPALLVCGIFEYIHYKVLGNNPDEDYYDE
jgi:hypothetical protein